MTLFNKIQVLGEHKPSLENICGQSYDNASNMKGLKKGLQALFKNINMYADYVPCAAHSLNLLEKGQCLLYLKLLTFLSFYRSCMFSFLDLHKDRRFSTHSLI